MNSYAELHCLSNFSFLRGASHPQELVEQARQQGYRALAITDECSLAGVVRAWQEAAKTGFHLIIGSEFRCEDGLRLVLLAENHRGYSQLCRLITRARGRVRKGAYRLDREDFTGITDCLALWLPAGQIGEAEAYWVGARFPGKAWIAVELHRGPHDDDRLAALRALSQRSGLPLVAAGDVHMHVPQRRALQDTLTAIRHGCTLASAGHRLFPNGERHLRPLPVLQELYPPELLRETLAIAQRCTFDLKELRTKYEYPRELVPPGVTAIEHLRQLTETGARRRWPGGVPARAAALIEKELALVAELGYEHYFLTVEDLVRYARSQGILCQGRGSAANSAMCYALGVTEVDPERGNALFERFISRERAEPPDIDIDFEHERREEVIQYIYRKYGRHRAALAATLITYKPRSAIRDAGKALGLSLDQVDALAKSLHWFDDLKEAPTRLRELGFDPESPVMRRLLHLLVLLIGFPRHLSQHVGGFVISEQPLHHLVPVENAAMPERTVIQWDKDDLDALGLLKVDVLALGMLTALRKSLDLVGRQRGRPFAMADIPPKDKKTYDMLSRGESVGVFQIESRAQMSMLPRLKPQCFYDLVIQIAIVRPGPIQGDMVHPYLRRRSGKEKVEYPSRELESVLGRTLGVPLFQEQVMQIAIVAAGFTPGEADQVRRSMAAWQRSGGLSQFREKLIAGMRARGYTPEFAERIYEQILGFGSYGFPESHSASFALLAYASAWLRCHEHAAFTAGLLNAQPMGFYQPAQLVNDARHHGVEVRPVDVHASDWDCTLEDSGDPRRPALRLGLRLVKGLPEAEARRVVGARAQGWFKSAEDLCARAQLSRRALNVLAEANALSGIEGHRHQARWSALGVEKLPGVLAGHAGAEMRLTLPAPRESQEITADYRAMGLTLRRHPLALLRPRLARLGVLRTDELARLKTGQPVRVAGLVTHRQRPGTASGVLFISLEDEAGIANLIVRPAIQEQQRLAVLNSKLMVVAGELQNEEGVIHVLTRQVRNYNRWLGGLEVESRDFQ